MSGRMQARRRGGFTRFVRGYLIAAGAVFTGYWLLRGFVWLAVYLKSAGFGA